MGIVIFLLVAFIFAVLPIWFSAKILGVRNSGLAPSIISLMCNMAITLGVKALITPSAIVGALIGIPLIAFLNAKIFNTTIIKGAIISILSGVILAIVVIILH